LHGQDAVKSIASRPNIVGEMKEMLKMTEGKIATVEISGNGNVAIWVIEKLEVRISGLGDVRYKGAPKVVRKISGAGSISPLD
jgi:hypothetical protein